MLTINNSNSISYRGIGPYSIPNITCTGSSAVFRTSEIDPLQALNADTYVKAHAPSEQSPAVEEKSLIAKFLGSFNYASLINSSAFYNRY